MRALREGSESIVSADNADAQIFGFADPNSKNWKEQTSIDLGEIEGEIPAGQTRTERRHIIAEESGDTMQKVEVFVMTDKRTYRWYGFSPNSNFACRSVPVNGGFPYEPAPAVEEAPAPAPAPASL